MSFAAIFQLSSVLVMPFWLLLFIAPHWHWTQRIVASPLIALPAALLYALLVLPSLPLLLPLLVNPSLASIAPLLGSEAGATIAWVHFLAFDLFVARWIALDSFANKLSPWVVRPLLFATLMVGPLGFALYLAARALNFLRQRGHQPLPELR